MGERDRHRKGGEEKALSAADKNIGNKPNSSHNSTQGTANTNTTANLEEISMHSPPKRSKTNQNEKHEEKKRDISREFDLNNIRSVVIIDDMPSSQDQQSSGKVAEDDFADFVTVKSKKQQREQRDRAREEEKKKLKIEQKKEAALINNKLQKERQANNRNNRESVQPKEQQQQANQQQKTTKSATEVSSTPPSTPSTDNNTVVVTTSATTTTAVVSVAPMASSAQGSNAAMAAIGGWEPAQSLMRTSQHTATTEQNKPIVTNVNAWQRPLSLTTVSSAPDPRAVGTGKPSSSQTNSIKVRRILHS